MLETSDLAPEFTLHDMTNAPMTLSSFKGQQVVLFFYPKDDTPGCTRESIGFSENKPVFSSLNTVVFGISKDSIDSHQKFCKKYELSVPLLSDESLDVLKLYGVWQEKKNYGKTYMGVVRTTVLINPEGRIQKIWKNVKVDGHVDKVLEHVRRIHLK